MQMSRTEGQTNIITLPDECWVWWWWWWWWKEGRQSEIDIVWTDYNKINVSLLSNG